MNPSREGSGTIVKERAAVAEENADGTDAAGKVHAPGGGAEADSAVRGPDAEAIEREARGRLYQELDILAFAFEMEASRALKQGDEAAAARAQQTRLGIRFAQRLVGGVPAPEVDRRLDRWRSTYLAKFPY